MIHLRCSHWWLELESTTWTRIVSVRSSFWNFDFWVLHRQAKELPFTQLNTRLTHGHWTFGSDHTHANSQLKLSSNFITYDKPINQICLFCCLLRCSAARLCCAPAPRRRPASNRRPPASSYGAGAGLREQSDQLVLLEAIASALAPALQVGQAGMLEPSASSTVLPAASSRAQFRSLNEVIQIYWE